MVRWKGKGQDSLWGLRGLLSWAMEPKLSKEDNEHISALTGRRGQRIETHTYMCSVHPVHIL